MALSRSFEWVVVNRDHDPDVPARFRVTAYPSLLVLGPEEENVHRFSGFLEPEPFLAELREGLRRWELFRAGEDWDRLPPRAPRIVDDLTVETLPAPSELVPAGLAVVDGALWVAFYGGRLHRVDPKDGAERAGHELPPGVIDICSDGRLLYAVTGAWTAGGPIHVLDPGSGEVLRTLVTEANASRRGHGAKGIAWKDGSLWVLEGMSGWLREVDPETGALGHTLETGLSWVTGLDCDGERFLTGDRERLHVLDGATGRPLRALAVHYPLRSVAWQGDRVLLMEQPVWGFDRRHERIQLWPRPGATKIHRLALEERRDG